MGKIVEEVTKLYPIEVSDIFIPHSDEELSTFLKNTKGKISIGGGRYSMGGQTAVIGGVQIDMREMKNIIHFSKEEKTITVQAGIIWRDIQDYIDPHDLSIMTMQTYSNFTVGGALSVNCHGRYIGYGPIILSVLFIKVALANGNIVIASPQENSDIFFATIGGYGGVSVIIEATLKLKDNISLARSFDDMDIETYPLFFRKKIRDNSDVIFHNGDIYPPHYSKVRATTWGRSDLTPTPKERLIPRNRSYKLHQHVYAIMRSGNTGKWFREHIIDPLVYRSKPVHKRNYEASYDVAELEPKSREKNSYILEEYFCPVEKFNEFVPKMREIFQRYDANVINVSIRHALPDSGSFLAWAKEEVFAFVIYYNQETSDTHRKEVAVWTRELIDAVISVGGRYYLPYQLHGTLDQVRKAYTQWDDYTLIKKKYDPEGRLSNMLLEKYYFSEDKQFALLPSRFRTVYDTETWRDRFYIFLQNIFHIAPTHLFHASIWESSQKYSTDKEIYEDIQRNLPTIKPFLSDLRYGIPALKFQKKEIVREAKELIGEGFNIDGYIEIGGAGRYIKPLMRVMNIRGSIYLISDEPIDISPVRILEREQIRKYNTKELTYKPENLEHIPGESIDLITIFIGLHHSPKEDLDKFFSSCVEKLRKGGKMIIRDHNVSDPLMHTFVAIAHDIYNAGTGISWGANEKEQRNFQSIAEWKIFFEKHGLKVTENILLQKNDPTANTLMLLTKIG